ncbi:MAG: maltose alpha-D-glucosyltransferase [Desulfobacterales bacterium]|nr:MAG: maltose alpha-D-glucosyltransferase [Desulfobacterales bacterium]
MDNDTLREDESLWYKDAIIYQLHVKTYYDSDEDGVGDFKGLTQKLDYLQNLGVTAIWLLPFYPSPLKDDGYDIADYTNIHPSYGNLRDFRVFLREAHRRGLKAITELVVNHTSDQHPWFKNARRAKAGSSRRNFYVWSDTADKYKETRIIFQDFESSNWTWDPVAGAYFWHRFYSHQPDLNYDNPQVHKAVLRALDFWLDMGVDGLRLDAVPYLYEREQTNCENLPETHAFLKKLRAHVDRKFKNRMLLGEANQWPEDVVDYFGRGDECHMNFHFPLMPRLFMALRMEDRFPIVDILEQTPPIPATCQWAVFLRNHDELTLEMVTDEERDYMYRVYARDPQMRVNLGIRRRLSPLLGNHHRRIELMNGLLFSMPGTPIIYYGDEIGMGDNIFLGDRNGVRTPMQWSADRNAGFSRGNPHRLYLPVIIDPEYHYEVVNAEAQENNRHSQLWWMRRLITLRKRFKAFSRGDLEFLHPENSKILAFTRCYQNECILVVANLSRFVQYVELDLSTLKNTIPIELFGRTEFPAVDGNPYFLTIGPHSFYWFFMQPAEMMEEGRTVTAEAKPLSRLEVGSSWEQVLRGRAKSQLEDLLPVYLRGQRWFGGKAQQVKKAAIQEFVSLQNGDFSTILVFAAIDYMDGNSETYVLPLAFVTGPQAEEVLHEHRWAALARLRIRSTGEEGLLFEATALKEFGQALIRAIDRRHRRKGTAGELICSRTRMFGRLCEANPASLEPSLLSVEQSNTSLAYESCFILKLFRRLQEGTNPDLEIGRFLTEKGFAHIPPVAGALEYRSGRQKPQTIGILQGFIPNQGDAWEYTLNTLTHYFEHVLEKQSEKTPPATPRASFVELAETGVPSDVYELIGFYMESVRILALRTAELHKVLASSTEDPKFAPEPFSKLYQRSLYQSMRTLAGRTLPLLRRQLKDLPEGVQQAGREVLELNKNILDRFHSLLDLKISGLRTRCHGDFHLGQVLFTGKDFVIIDFEGEPARPISERQIKRSPLRDVAGMLRSFHYAAYAALMTMEKQGVVQTESLTYLESWANHWYVWVCAAFLEVYIDQTAGDGFVPDTKEEMEILLDALLLEKAIYELGYELNNRPDWGKIPIHGIRQLLQKV